MDEDKEMDNCLADIEDVVNGYIIDMAHAELMEPLTDSCSDLENELQMFYMTEKRNAIINKMSVDELKSLIDAMNTLTQTIRAYSVKS
jgi:hypothetical protein